MVAHPRVLPVVRANLLGPRAAANLGLPPSRDLVLLLLEMKLEQLGAEDLHGADAVLQLGSLLRAEYADAGGFVHEVDGRLHLVNVLATRAAGPRGADIDMVAISWPQQSYEEEARPTLTYSDQMTLHFNGHTIEIRNYGPAHTTGDSFIFFKESNVLHMGDVANLTGLPYIDAGNGGTVDGMIYSIKKALTMIDENTIVVLGHGEISGREDLEIYLAKIELVRNRVFNMIEEGMSLKEILREDPGAEVFPSSPFDAGFGIPASHTFVDRAYVSMKKN